MFLGKGRLSSACADDQAGGSRGALRLREQPHCPHSNKRMLVGRSSLEFVGWTNLGLNSSSATH